MPEDDLKTILDTLEQLYGIRGNAARFYRFKDLVTTSLDGCSSVTAYINSLKLHFKQLDELDSVLPKWVLVSLILFGLGDTYDSYIVNTVSAIRTTTPKLNDLHLKKQPEKSSESSKEKKDGKKENSSKNEKPEQKNKKRDELVDLIAYVDPASEPACIFDLGVLYHMYNNKDLFTKFMPAQRTVRVANSSSMPIRGTGTVQFIWETQAGTTYEVVLSEVLYTLELYTNLLAYNALAKKSIYATLAPTGTTIWKNSIQIGYCIRRNGLMFLKTLSLIDGDIATALIMNADSSCLESVCGMLLLRRF
ncbi:hypothetical protein GP486_001996 [Trichoglossum hirsutum]|uniref:Retrovirus-related Pol polyprotein from transposon TNT 1-94-like beta-barrel domain-containing protein n=1 Tax=Trichoglossum hirsutum TaxID=265104 RepID=A0A9P8LFS5_9PEZI|nr:hypothetical protein GP486_001996 [Trichoglossum hirsutum]